MSSLIAYAKNCSLNEMVETEINILTYNSELWPSWSSYASELSIDILYILTARVPTQCP